MIYQTKPGQDPLRQSQRSNTTAQNIFKKRVSAIIAKNLNAQTLREMHHK